MDIRPIKSETDYDWALSELEAYFEHEPEPGTPDAARFDVLSILVESYEAISWPIEAPGPIDAIRFCMEQSDYTQSDLARVVGSRSRASEILSGRRGLTMRQAWKLHRDWKVPAESLLRPMRK